MQDIIADIFDFGDTLALHSTSSCLEHRGVNGWLRVSGKTRSSHSWMKAGVQYQPTPI